MARGFLSGILWGGVLGLGVSGVASVLAPPPVPPEVSDAAPGGVEAPERITDPGSGEQASTADRAPVSGQVAPQAPVPEADSLAALDGGALDTAAQPQTGAADGLATPAAAPQAGGVVAQGDAPVLPNPQALAPMAPEPADELSISTEPAQPPTPPVEEAETAFEEPETDTSATDETQADATGDVTAETGSTAEAPEYNAPDTTTAEAEADPSDTAEQPAQTPSDRNATDAAEGTEEATAEPPVSTAPQAEVAVVTPEPPATENTDVAVLAPAPESEPAPRKLPEPLAPADAAEAVPQPENTPQTGTTGGAEATVASARPAIGKPATRLTDRTSGVTIRRPGSASVEEVETGDVVPVASDATAQDADARPIVRFGEPFEDAGDKPLMSIVLIDDGSSPVAGSAGIAALGSFPYPLTFAVDGSMPEAADRVAIYRAAGFEVMAMIDLPEGAQPSDAETTLGVILPRLGEVVGVLEGTGTGLQETREVADQVSAILAQTGHGLLTQDKGLNTMPKLARKAGVPADPVFRDFDSKGQSATVIRRFLDGAAFKASQEGAVVMLGRLRPDTISALLLWGLQDRASTVALTPVSAVLLRAQ